METRNVELELLSLHACAELTGRKLSTWRKDVLLRKIPVVRIGRQIRVRRSDLEKLLARGFRPALVSGNNNAA